MATDYRQVIRDILAELLNSILRVEHKAIGTVDPLPLTMSELHIIEAVGDYDGRCIMTDVARKLQIALPTLTASVDRLEDKGYLERNRSTSDRRRVTVALTDSGRLAYRRHAVFHEKMVDAFLDGVVPERMPELLQSMVRLRDFLRLMDASGGRIPDKSPLNGKTDLDGQQLTKA